MATRAAERPLRICLLTNQDLLADPFPADDWPCDPRPFYPDAHWEVECLREPTSVAQVTRRIEEGFDVFFNLCDGAADQKVPGIEVVRTLDHEIMTSFASAAADVNEHFSALIAMLFPGGTGRLKLVDPDDLLNTGVEIEVRPAGRNVRRVSLLSGGERSMAALAFLFAVFRSRPSPFYMMDEVEAALDDVNLTRFLALVHEFRDEAQLLIVSHQKRTMETGDALYGVTMAPGGSSQVVSQKVAKEREPA